MPAYDCGSIEVLEGLEPVRRRPGMYLGDTRDGSGLHQVVWEVVDNAVDQHRLGRCQRIDVTLHAGGALTVEDDGPGIPVEPLGGRYGAIPPIEMIFTRLYATGSPWQPARALNSVGVACVCAVCEHLVVEVRRRGQLHRQAFQRGRATGPLVCVGPASGTGTRITLHPDPLIFPSTAFDARRLQDRLRELAFLNPGLRLDFADERAAKMGDTHPGGRRASFLFEGLDAWVALLTEGQAVFPGRPLRVRGTHQLVSVDVALAWTHGRDPRIKAFVDQQRVERGAPFWGLYGGIWRALSAGSAAAGLGARPRKPQALRCGLVAVVDVRGGAVDLWRSFCDDDGVRDAVRKVVGDGLGEALRSDRALLEGLRGRAAQT